MNIDLILTEHRLFFDNHYEQTAKLFCNLTGPKSTLTKERFLLNNWYEGYLYTLILGIRINNREKFIARGDKAPKWSSNYLKQYKYAISHLISRSDILHELGIADYQSIKENMNTSKEIIDKIKNICDEFSNGGLKYLSELHEKDNSIFQSHDALIDILKKK